MDKLRPRDYEDLRRRQCLILVNISMFCNQCKNLLEETYLQSFWKITAMPVRLAQTISSKYYILLFSLNLIITLIVILLVCSTVCSDVQLLLYCTKLMASPNSLLKVYFFQIGGIIRLNRTGISNFTEYLSKKWNLVGPQYTVGLWQGSQARSYMKEKPFLSQTLCKIDKVLTLGQSLLI